ncbi:zinc-binding dehydrogenase [Nocardia sp. NPDC050710]|uniref:quinone oxidoreductase family protein n=1 Tax=Nocardia sp. NPDC050710 TaxID=3157220 RepID=UPI0033F5B431
MGGSVARTLLDSAALTWTETVLIEAAATGVGAALTQLVARRGAHRVLAAAGGPAKAERARKLDADEVIDHNDPEWPARLRETLGAISVDVVFDSIGGETADVMTPLRGRMLGYGFLSGAPAQLSAMDLITRGLTFVGCAGPQWLARVAAERAATLESAVAGELEALVESVLPLTQASEAHRLLEDRVPLGKIILRPDT